MMSKRSIVLLASCLVSVGCGPDEGESSETILADFGDELLDDDTDDTDDAGTDDVGTTDDDSTGDGDASTTTTDDDADTTTTDDGNDDTTTTGGDTSPCTAPDPGWGGFAAVGQPAPHFSGTNQFGEEVSICAYEGLPLVIDTSAVWCGPCQMLSLCLGGDDNQCLSLFGGDPQVLTYLIYPLREQISAGTFAWVTVLMENQFNGPPALSDAQAWDQAFPVENVWVIPDVDQKYYPYLQISAFPSVWLIDGQMNWQDLNQQTVFTTIIGEL
jgi:hypothetical protein